MGKLTRRRSQFELLHYCTIKEWLIIMSIKMYRSQQLHLRNKKVDSCDATIIQMVMCYLPSVCTIAGLLTVCALYRSDKPQKMKFYCV